MHDGEELHIIELDQGDGWSFVLWVLVMCVQVEQLTPHREQ
jgi:hypothetical protein